MTASLAAVAIAVGSAFAAVLLAVAQRRRVAARPSPDAARLLAGLRGVPLGERIGRAAREARPGSWEAAVAAELSSARNGEIRAAEIDAALADVEGSLVAVRGWSAAALRVGLLGGLLGGAIALADRSTLLALVSAVVGACSAAVAGILGQGSEAIEQQQRRLADELVAVLVGGRTGPPPGARAGARRGFRGPVLDRTDGGR